MKTLLFSLCTLMFNLVSAQEKLPRSICAYGVELGTVQKTFDLLQRLIDQPTLIENQPIRPKSLFPLLDDSLKIESFGTLVFEEIPKEETYEWIEDADSAIIFLRKLNACPVQNVYEFDMELSEEGFEYKFYEGEFAYECEGEDYDDEFIGSFMLMEVENEIYVIQLIDLENI